MAQEVCKFRRGALSRLSAHATLRMWVEAMSQPLVRGLDGESGGGGPGQAFRCLTRASVIFGVISVVCGTAGCLGPGLEPPDKDGAGMAVGGHSGAAAGTGGMSGAG